MTGKLTKIMICVNTDKIAWLARRIVNPRRVLVLIQIARQNQPRHQKYHTKIDVYEGHTKLTALGRYKGKITRAPFRFLRTSRRTSSLRSNWGYSLSSPKPWNPLPPVMGRRRPSPSSFKLGFGNCCWVREIQPRLV